MRFQIACAAALFVVAAACSDAPLAPPSGSQIVPANQSATLAGTIVTTQTDTGSMILLLRMSGDSVVLLGPVALDASQNAAGAPLWVTGVFNAPNVMYVATYEKQADGPIGCSPMILSQPGRIELPCQDGAAVRRR